jgi:hypothetical protein
MSLKITVTDIETGETEESTVADGDYVIVCAAPCHLGDIQAYPTKGTHVLTVKGRTAP